MDSQSPHHTSRGFRNIWPEIRQYHTRDLLRWIRERRRSDRPRYASSVNTLTVTEQEWDLIRNPADGFAVTWLGHASCLIQLGGLNVLTYPIFSERCSPFRFAGPKLFTPLPLQPFYLPALYFFLISHNHYDHLDITALLQLYNSVNKMDENIKQHRIQNRAFIFAFHIQYVEHFLGYLIYLYDEMH